MVEKGVLGSRKGQSTVEFSFVFVFLLVLAFALADLTQISYNWVVLQYAASEASRFGSLGKIDEGAVSREESMVNRVNQITSDLGLDDVSIEFTDEFGGATAGAASEYFQVKLTRALQLWSLLGGFFYFVGVQEFGAPTYDVTVHTVIRNEPF